MNEIQCVAYKAMEKGALQGFATIYVPQWDLEIFNISVFSKNSQKWVGMPSRQTVDESGAKSYFPYLRFRDKKNLDGFGKKVIQAIEKFNEKSSGGYQGYVPDEAEQKGLF